MTELNATAICDTRVAIVQLAHELDQLVPALNLFGFKSGDRIGVLRCTLNSMDRVSQRGCIVSDADLGEALLYLAFNPEGERDLAHVEPLSAD